MSKDKKHSKRNLQDFLRYSDNQMSQEERHVFERGLQKDPFEEDAMEGFSGISSEEIKVDLGDLKNRLHRRTHQRSKAVFYRMAAAIAALLVIGSVFFSVFTNRLDQAQKNVAITERSESGNKDKISPTVPELYITEDSNEMDSEKSEPKQGKGEQQRSEQISHEKEIPSADKEKEIAEDEMMFQIIEAEESEIAEREIEASAPEPAQPNMVTGASAKKVSRSKSGKAESPIQSADSYAPDQTRMITGEVFSKEDNRPIIGANLIIKDKSGGRIITGTISDPAGNYLISVPPGSSHTIEASFIGWKSQEEEIADRSEINFFLQADRSTRNKVVLVRTYPVADQWQNLAVNPPEYTPAQPAEGENKFEEYVADNLFYPEQDSLSTEAIVVLNFRINQAQRPYAIEVVSTAGEAFSREAIRVLEAGPDWKPPSLDGKPMNAGVYIRILFKPSEN